MFSGGRFAVVRFKKEFNTPLIGEPTGGAAKSYGNRKSFLVDEKSFSVSTSFFDFSDIFGYDGAIQPDIYVKRLMEDRRDKALEVALNEIEKMKKNAEKIDSGIEK